MLLCHANKLLLLTANKLIFIVIVIHYVYWHVINVHIYNSCTAVCEASAQSLITTFVYVRL